MKTFHCDNCRHVVFIENTVCTHCDSKLAYLPDRMAMAAIQPIRDGAWTPRSRGSGRGTYRLCANYETQQVCNWAVASADSNALCLSCRLTRTIPDLGQEGNRLAWYKLESAKRRLVCGLLALQLPLESRQEKPEGGLAFDFLADAASGSAPVLTGHDGGLITINLAEADDAERERRRMAMHEPYRTVLGHFRHEIGHYYWDRLVDGSDQLGRFRALFGDETQDYAAALKRHYEQGPAPDWNERYISEYASTHPWEDWAETWAHYLHIVDTLETASESGLSLRPALKADGAFRPLKMAQMRSPAAFPELIAAWFPLAGALNNFARGLGMQDAYPFVLTPAVVAKLGFVHAVIAARR